MPVKPASSPRWRPPLKGRGVAHLEVNVHQAKTHLSRLLARVLAGEEVIIARANKPVARLVRYERPRSPRILGLDAGQVWMAEDFDETPEEVRRSFEESDLEPSS